MARSKQTTPKANRSRQSRRSNAQNRTSYRRSPKAPWLSSRNLRTVSNASLPKRPRNFRFGRRRLLAPSKTTWRTRNEERMVFACKPARSDWCFFVFYIRWFFDHSNSFRFEVGNCFYFVQSRLSLSCNRGVPMASRRAQILLTVFYPMRVLTHAAHHRFNSGTLPRTRAIIQWKRNKKTKATINLVTKKRNMKADFTRKICLNKLLSNNNIKVSQRHKTNVEDADLIVI